MTNPVVERARGIVRDIRYVDETTRLARLSTEAPRIPWDKFFAEIQWIPGEHLALIGPTGQGKTTMLINLLDLHPYVVAFATKPRDRTMEALIQHGGYVRIDRWRSMDPDKFPRRVLWPDATRIDSDQSQKAVFHDAFARIYREGHWTVALDETWYVDNILKLEKDIKVYLLQARSLGISLATGFQRPAWVPRELYTSSTHLMFWRTNDETDLKSLGGIGAKSADLIRSIVVDLESHQVLYINTRTGFMCRTRCPNVQYGQQGLYATKGGKNV
jgi:hypothetical protein